MNLREGHVFVRYATLEKNAINVLMVDTRAIAASVVLKNSARSIMPTSLIAAFVDPALTVHMGVVKLDALSATPALDAYLMMYLKNTVVYATLVFYAYIVAST